LTAVIDTMSDTENGNVAAKTKKKYFYLYGCNNCQLFDQGALEKSVFR